MYMLLYNDFTSREDTFYIINPTYCVIFSSIILSEVGSKFLSFAGGVTSVC